MKKIRFLILALVGLLGGVVSASGKTVYIQPNAWANDNAIISLNVWVNGTGGNIWTTLTEVEDGILKATFDDSFNKMAIMRGPEANKWNNEGAWNQTADMDIEDGKLYKLYDYDGQMSGIYIGHGVVVEDYTEPAPAAGYLVDFNTAITTSNHDFVVASNWKHIVGSNNYDGYGPYYMQYVYSATGGVDDSGTLRAGAQNGYWTGSTQSGADFTDGSYDYLVTPLVNGTVTLQVKRYAVSGYSSYVKVFYCDENGTTVGQEIATTITPDISDSEWSTLTLTLSGETRLAIRAQAVLLDNFTATSATIIPIPAMTITSVKRVDNESTTYFDMNADGTYNVKYLVKVQNTGEVALVSGTTDNYSLSISIDGTLYGTFNVPVDLAVGETSDEFEASIVMPATAPTGWKYRYLTENLGGTKDNSSLAWSNTIAYNPVPFFIKKGDEPISKGSSLTSVTTLNFGMIGAETTENYEIFAHNAGDLTIKSIATPTGFAIAPAQTLPYTIPAHSGMYVDVTASGAATTSGDMVITYVDKNGADQTVNVTLSQTFVDASKWMATFDGGVWPEGSVHESNLSIGSNSYYGYDNAVKSTRSTYNKFYTPLLHAAAGGEALSFDAMLNDSYGTLNVYVTNDRSNLGSSVLHLTNTQLNTSSLTNMSVTVPEGDYYVVFEAYCSIFDNLYGLELVPVTHDIMVNSYKIGYNAEDKTIQTGTAQDFNLEVIPAISEAADAYSVKLYANNEVVATAESVALTSGTSKTFKLTWTPNVTTTTVYETHVAIEFTDNTSIVSPSLNLTVTCEPIFVFFDAGTTVGSSQPSNRSKAITFGKTNELNLVQNFEIYNYGKADLTVKSITVPNGFSVNVANATVAPATRQPVDITFSATTPGAYEGDLSIVYVDKDGLDQTFTLAISGTMLDPNKWYANFDNTTNAIKWPAGSVYQSHVDNTYRGTYSDNNYFIYNSSYTTDNMFITPKLSATANEEFQFDVAPQSQNSDGYIKIYTSTDRETWGEPVETIEITKGASYTETNTFVTKTVAMPAGEYYVGVQMYYAKVDEICGLTPVAVAHDWMIASSNIPTEAMQNVASTASVNILNLGLQDEAADDITVTAYVDGEAVATGEGVAIPMSHLLNAEGTKLSVSIIYPKVGTFPVYLEVKAGDYSVQTEPVDVTFAEEEAKSEIGMESNGASATSLLHLNWNNSESVNLYSAATLESLGLKSGDKISSITFRGYNSGSKNYSTTLNVWYEFTDDATQAAPSSGKYDTSSMTNVVNTERSWANAEGSSSNLVDIITINFAEPITFTGKSLRIVVCSEGTQYQSGTNFELSKISGSGTSYYNRNDTYNTFANTQSWSANAYLPAIHFGLAAQSATLAGNVRTSAGAGIANATVTLKAENGVEYSATSDAEGNYSMNVIQAGLDFTATVEAEGFLKREFAENLGGVSKTLDVTMYTQYGIVGSIPGLSWDEDAVMTQDEENPMVFTLVKDVVVETAGDYNYKMRADGAWAGNNEGQLAHGYELPASGNNTVNFPSAGTYVVTFTADVDQHSLDAEVALKTFTLAENACEEEQPNIFEITSEIANLTVERTFNQGWNAVVLPFALTQEEITTTFGEGSKVAYFNGDTEDANGNVTVKFDELTGDLAANVPYMIYVATATTNPTFNNKTFVDPNFAELKAEVSGTAFDFMGTYVKLDVNAGDMFVSGGKFKTATTNNKVRAFRAYLKSKTEGARQVNIFVDGEEISIATPTAIDGIDVDNIDGNVYNINGQRVNKNVKHGVYIINGKKVVRK